MTAQETNLLNAFETTLTGTIGASDLTFTVNSVVDSASNTLAAPCYLVLNPDSATNREVVQVTSINVGTKTLTLDNINKRYLTGSAATSGLSYKLLKPDNNGLKLMKGFTSRVIATSMKKTLSYRWHPNPDGGATFPTEDSAAISTAPVNPSLCPV